MLAREIPKVGQHEIQVVAAGGYLGSSGPSAAR
jgi:hypothetical protein